MPATAGEARQLAAELAKGDSLKVQDAVAALAKQYGWPAVLPPPARGEP